MVQIEHGRSVEKQSDHNTNNQEHDPKENEENRPSSVSAFIKLFRMVRPLRPGLSIYQTSSLLGMAVRIHSQNYEESPENESLRFHLADSPPEQILSD